jgi:hypothetical protein
MSLGAQRSGWSSSAIVAWIRGWQSRSPGKSRRAALHLSWTRDFEEDILDFLQRAHELVVLLTPWALERPYVWAEIGAAWGRRIPIVALSLGITATELQVRPGIPVLLKKRDLLELNDIDVYLGQLAARVQREG